MDIHQTILNIRSNSTGSNLNLSYFMMGQLDAVELADALKDNSTITNLNISFSIYDAEIIKPLADALKVNSTITNLDLPSNQFGPEGLVALADALKVNSTITNLDLSSNEIGTVGVIALAEALKVNSTITNLDLSSNQFGLEGIRALADALKVNSSITDLNLSSNQFGLEGIRALAEALKVNSSITNLDLSSNQFGLEGLIALADALKVNSTITTLNLRKNSIDDKGIEVLLVALRENTTITDLVFSPKLTSKGVLLYTKLKKTFMVNKKIQRLYELFQKQIFHFDTIEDMKKTLKNDIMGFLQQRYTSGLIINNEQNQQENKLLLTNEQKQQEKEKRNKKKEQLYNSFREYCNFKYPTKILKTLSIQEKKKIYIPKKLLLQFLDIYTHFPNNNKTLRKEIIEKLSRLVSLDYINVIETLNNINYPFKQIKYKENDNYKEIEKKLFETYKNEILDKIISSNKQKIKLPKINKHNIQQTNKKLQSMKENDNIHNQQTYKMEANILYYMLPETFIEKYFNHENERIQRNDIGLTTSVLRNQKNNRRYINNEFLSNPILIKVPDNKDCGFHVLSLFLRKHKKVELTDIEEKNVNILRESLIDLYNQELEEINPTSTIQLYEQKRARERKDQLMDRKNDQRKWLYANDMILLAKEYGLCFYIRKLDNNGNMVQQIITEDGTFEHDKTFKEKVIECNQKIPIFLDNPNGDHYDLIVSSDDKDNYTGLSFQDFEIKESIDPNVYDFKQKKMNQVIQNTIEIQNSMKKLTITKKQS